MSPNLEESFKMIKEKVKHLTQTTEYMVLDEFDKLGYMASTHYYKDYDPSKGVDVIRELDIGAVNSFRYIIEGIESTLFIRFLGDVKFHKTYAKRIIVGFTAKQKSSQSGIKNTVTRLSAFSNLYILGDLEIFEPPFPICRHLRFFGINEKENKEEIKRNNQNLREYCEQITSGFSVERSKEFESLYRNSKKNLLKVVIPILVFGNEITFMVGNPLEFEDDRVRYPKAIFYLFQSARPSAYPLTPILVTSLNYLSETIEEIEEVFKNNFKKNFPIES